MFKLTEPQDRHVHQYYKDIYKVYKLKSQRILRISSTFQYVPQKNNFAYSSR